MNNTLNVPFVNSFQDKSLLLPFGRPVMYESPESDDDDSGAGITDITSGESDPNDEGLTDLGTEDNDDSSDIPDTDQDFSLGTTSDEEV